MVSLFRLTRQQVRRGGKYPGEKGKDEPVYVSFDDVKKGRKKRKRSTQKRQQEDFVGKSRPGGHPEGGMTKKLLLTDWYFTRR